jgi:hypothetical protein
MRVVSRKGVMLNSAFIPSNYSKNTHPKKGREANSPEEAAGREGGPSPATGTSDAFPERNHPPSGPPDSAAGRM